VSVLARESSTLVAIRRARRTAVTGIGAAGPDPTYAVKTFFWLVSKFVDHILPNSLH